MEKDIPQNGVVRQTTLLDVLHAVSSLLVPPTRVRILTQANKELQDFFSFIGAPDERLLRTDVDTDFEVMPQWKIPRALTTLRSTRPGTQCLQNVLYTYLLSHGPFLHLTNLDVTFIEAPHNPWAILRGRSVPALQRLRVNYSEGTRPFDSLLLFCGDLPMSLTRLILTNVGITDMSLSEDVLQRLGSLSLVELDMSDNYLEPRGVARVISAVNKTSIETLLLGHTYANFERDTSQASGLPGNIESMTNLKGLCLARMYFSSEDIQEIIGKIPLTMLSLDLEAVTRDENLQRTTLQGLTRLEDLLELSLNGNQCCLCEVLNVLPTSIIRLYLSDLQGCSGSSQLQRFERMTNLEDLRIGRHREKLSPRYAAEAMLHMPPTLKVLHLRYFVVNFSFATPVPCDFGHLVHLQRLVVSGQRWYESIIHNLPLLGKLYDLQLSACSLGLNNAAFANVLRCVDQCTSLRRLDLAHNKITSIPNPQRFSNLTELCLLGNTLNVPPTPEAGYPDMLIIVGGRD